MLVLKFGISVLTYLGHNRLQIGLLFISLAVQDIFIERGRVFDRDSWSCSTCLRCEQIVLFLLDLCKELLGVEHLKSLFIKPKRTLDVQFLGIVIDNSC